MKRITFLPFALAAGFVCLQPLSIFAQDQDQNTKDKKQAEGSHQRNRRTPKVTKQVQSGIQQGVTPREDRLNTHKTTDTYRSTRSTNMNTNTSTQVVQEKRLRQSQQNQTQSPRFTVQGTRSNHYGGRWFDASIHSDWNRDSDHYWNHHHYRWYDGGWLIVDIGPSPAYYHTGSLGSSVQARLAELGYYNGPIDGYIGMGTHDAIANYQADHGLRVNGRINDSLLVSLGLE